MSGKHNNQLKMFHFVRVYGNGPLRIVEASVTDPSEVRL